MEGTDFADSLDNELAYSTAFAERGVELVASRLDANTEFTGLPGERYSYCNDGYGLLSDIIRTHGPYSSYGEYVESEICAPPGMTRTNISYIRNSLDENASILWRKRDGRWLGDRDYTDNAFMLPGGGAMKSSLSDMLKYIAMFLNEGASPEGVRILDEGRIRLMEQAHILDSPVSAYGYGLSSFYMDGHRIMEHSGGLTGVSSQIMFSPLAGIGVVVLCNTSSVPVGCIAKAVLSQALGLPEETATQTVTGGSWSVEEVRGITGHYYTAEDDELTLTAEGSELTLTVNGSQADLMRKGPWLGCARRSFSSSWLSAMPDAEGGVAILQYGSRIYRRVSTTCSTRLQA